MSSELKQGERSLYPGILKHLQNIGIEGVSEIKRGDNYIDILFEIGKNRFILEVKVEKKNEGNPMVDAIVQAYRYGLENNTKNLIAVCYPSSISEDILSIEEVEEKTLKTRVECAMLTQFWYSHETKFNIEEILSSLKFKVEQNISAQLNVNLTSEIIRKCVVALSKLINKQYKDEKGLNEATQHLTRDYGLFVNLSRSKIRRSQMRNQTIDLLAYILVNQILFYFLYSKKSHEIDGSQKVDEINKITYLGELDKYFNQIKAIDYKPIFDILIVQRIPSTIEIVEEVNKLIACLVPLQISEMKHDLYGRLIGNSLPKETRKILASYYTISQSADLLANITIDEYDNRVWDLACGSGTLLVASYDRKLKLFREKRRQLEPTDKDKLHLKFIQEQLTGTDIMPFACHLTGLNLSARNLKNHTNSLRISNMNSLSIESLEKPMEIYEAYGDISAELSRLKISQKTLDNYDETNLQSTEYTPHKFTIEKVERIVINPPFTNINKLPPNYRKSFTSSESSKICGKRIALWGHFMSLVDRVLQDGGKIGAIIPISLLHGNDTHQVRKYFIENYSIDYIIKPAPGTSFSEDSEFTDIIFVAKKVSPKNHQKVRIVCMKKNLEDLNTLEVESLAKNITTQLDDEKDDSDYFSFSISQNVLTENIDNLMRFVFTNNSKIKNMFDSLNKKLENPNLMYIEKDSIHDGNQLRPKGTAANCMFTRYYSDIHVKRSILVFENDPEDSLMYYNKNNKDKLTIDKSELIKTFRTLAGIDKIDVTLLHDYILKDKMTTEKRSHLLIPMRYRINTLEMYLMAVYTEESICPYNSFTMYLCPKEDAKILSIFFNSIFYLIQFLMIGKQSTRGFLELRQIDLKQIRIPNISLFDKSKRTKILSLFKELQKNRFENILSQLKNKPEYRLKIDKLIAECIGLKCSENELKKIYDLAYLQITTNLQ